MWPPRFAGASTATAKAIAGVGTSLGYDFTAEELAWAFAMRMKAEYEAAEGHELSEEELVQVAGGKDKCKDNYDGSPNCTATSSAYRSCWVVEDCGMIVAFTH